MVRAIRPASVPTRASGISASAASKKAGEAELHEWSVDEAGHHGVHADALGAEHQRGGAGRPRSAHLEDGDSRRVSRDRCDRADVDDARTRSHQRHQRLDAEHRSGDVDVEGAVPRVTRKRSESVLGRDAGVVDQTMHLAVLLAQPVGQRRASRQPRSRRDGAHRCVHQGRARRWRWPPRTPPRWRRPPPHPGRAPPP